ncbi:MAG: glyoxalase/bleomycin resistance/extradiol dioxygenase family protein [Phycisphaeraceae bacterium]|nr:MAG: glyoxalase/bleomycin resistance/extradiol dioxygenase family protein [Phycisphaeraceae bacterium]
MNAPPLRRILETALYIEDLDAAETFYRDALGLEVIMRTDGRDVFFRCGDSMLLIFNPHVSAVPEHRVPTHGAHGPGHMAFGADAAGLEAWRARLQEHGIPIERDIEWPNGARSIYFRDPGDNSIEIATPSLWNLA